LLLYLFCLSRAHHIVAHAARYRLLPHTHTHTTHTRFTTTARLPSRKKETLSRTLPSPVLVMRTSVGYVGYHAFPHCRGVRYLLHTTCHIHNVYAFACFTHTAGRLLPLRFGYDITHSAHLPQNALPHTAPFSHYTHFPFRAPEHRCHICYVTLLRLPHFTLIHARPGKKKRRRADALLRLPLTLVTCGFVVPHGLHWFPRLLPTLPRRPFHAPVGFCNVYISLHVVHISTARRRLRCRTAATTLRPTVTTPPVFVLISGHGSFSHGCVHYVSLPVTFY